MKLFPFCRKMKRNNINKDFWTEGLSLYVDCVGFEYKTNPYEYAKTLGSREWGMISEGLDINCTSKGKKEGKTCISFLVGMSYNKGVLLCIPLTQRMCGQYYSELIENYFQETLQKSEKTCNRVLQDDDPSQNSKIARDELDIQNIKLFSIPARSPDLNPIENLFNQVRQTIKKDSLQKQLQRETKVQFTSRVQDLLLNLDITRI